MTAPKGKGRALEYSGKLQISDRYDFDPDSVRNPSKGRSEDGEMDTIIGQGLPGTAFNIASGELNVRGSGGQNMHVTGEQPAPERKDEKK